jgi:Viral BACON domain
MSRLVTLVLLSAITMACGSTSTSTVAGPSPVKCQVTASNATPAFEATGGTGAVSVQAARECTWSAAAQAGWIAITPPTEGQGDGTLRYSVQANPAGTPRQGGINLNGQMVEVSQRGAPCVFTVSRSSVEIPAEQTVFEVELRGPIGCTWSASSEAPWLTLAAGAQGSGPGILRVSAAPNPGGPRRGAVSAAGIRVEVLQLAAGQTPTPSPEPSPPAPGPQPPGACTFTLAPDRATFPASGGDGEAALQTGSDCAWTAASDAAWLSVTSQAAGTGQARITYRVDPNAATSARTGRLTIGTAVLLVEQGAAGDQPPPPACTYTVEPLEIAVGAGEETGSVRVRTANDCAWTASSDAGWVTITSAASGTGNGEVQYRTAANPDSVVRTGTLQVAGQTVVITQAGVSAPPPGSATFSGAVTELSGTCNDITFAVDGEMVRATSATTYVNGSCNKVKNGERLRGDGTPDGGVIVAREIVFDKDADIVP